MKKLLNILKFILNHPIGKKRKFKTFFRFLKWQIFSKVFDYKVIVPYVANSKLILKKSLHSATANYYVGLQEFEEMAFTLHLLNKNDIFCDIGANIGIYTILASKIKFAKTYSFEPIKETFFYLKNNVVLNEIENIVVLNNFALGYKSGQIKFTTDLDSENHVLTDNSNSFYEVKIEKLDNILNEIPILMKLDVEGFEYYVLKGAENLLLDKNLKAIIIEINGSSKRYGIEEDLIQKLLTDKGFKIYSYLPIEKEFIEKKSYKNGNNIYIRDIDFVKNRVNSSEKIVIYDTKI
ncbi:MAG: FkbM family methyltransferase [Bacteroidales bacterium]|nr:FkbM family methyltransferase [Bacteroidales bacterium]MBN2757663.1 FkbM family methyltransferase [Bacteroidales bacterium]